MKKRDIERQEKREVQSTNFKNNWNIAIETIVDPRSIAAIEEAEKELKEAEKPVYPFLRKYIKNIHKAKKPIIE